MRPPGVCRAPQSVWLSPIVEFGVYVINNDSLPFPHMIGRAKLALKETSTELRGRLRYAVYDDAIRRQLGSLRQQASTYRQNFRMLLNAQMQLLDESGLGRERERAEEPPTARMAAMPRINLTENRQEAAESKKGLQDQPLTSAARRIVPIPQEDE